MTFNRIALAGIVSLAGSLAASGEVKAASYQHIDRLAVRIQCQAAELYREFRLHYRHTPEFAHLLSDSSTLYSTARHVHQVAHNHGSVHHLQMDLRELDRRFHHLEEVLEHVELDAGHGSGHIHGDTSHVHRLMDRIEDNIHHLRADIKEMAHHGHRGHYGRHGSGHGRHGVSYPVTTGIRFGRGGFTFTWPH